MAFSGGFLTREVWANNLDTEFHHIRSSIDRFNHVSTDPFRHSTPADHYAVVKSNVDKLNLIQVGLTLTDEVGNLPDLGLESGFCYIWEFNFKDFDLSRDDHAEDSIKLLKRQGIDFEKSREFGIDSSRFAELVMSSGILCNDCVTWVTFHSSYDFGYLVKILTMMELPDKMEGFLDVVKVLFGNRVYDLKHMIRFCGRLCGGLDKVANALAVERVVGKCHQAGSDSLLTWQVFQCMRDLYFVEDGGVDRYAGVIYGLEAYGDGREY